MTDIITAIQSLNKKNSNNHEFVIRDKATNEAEYNSNVDFVSGSNDNGTAIFSDTKPYTWSEVNAEKELLQAEYDQAIIDRDNKKASAKQKLQDLGLTAEEIKETFGL